MTLEQVTSKLLEKYKIINIIDSVDFRSRNQDGCVVKVKFDGAYKSGIFEETINAYDITIDDIGNGTYRITLFSKAGYDFNQYEINDIVSIEYVEE